MNSIALFFETKQGKYIKNLIIGLGASVVLVGALAKIQHWSWAGPALTAGMLTEAFIFAILGILPPHKDYYWERYYPNIDQNPHVEAYRKGVKSVITPIAGITQGNNNSKDLNQMLEEAEITPTNLRRLSENFQRFGQTVEQVRDISNVAASTEAYSTAARETAETLNQLKGTFAGASQTMGSFNAAAEDTANFHQQVVVLSRNLGSLNQIYEVELQDANNHLKAMNKFYSNLVSASDAMSNSADDARAAKEQMAKLAQNLTSLNSIYGNMLGAMQGR
jgi:gliding motility-associated protein GldL